VVVAGERFRHLPVFCLYVNGVKTADNQRDSYYMSEIKLFSSKLKRQKKSEDEKPCYGIKDSGNRAWRKNYQGEPPDKKKTYKPLDRFVFIKKRKQYGRKNKKVARQIRISGKKKFIYIIHFAP
jgi:hypothetical protein